MHKFLLLTLLVFIPHTALLADDWGGWNELPDNLLQEDDEFESLSELSKHLDSLLEQGQYGDIELPEELLNEWLTSLGDSDDSSIRNLEKLLEERDELEDEEDYRKWQEDLEDELEDLAEELQDEEDEIDNSGSGSDSSGSGSGGDD